MGLGISIAVGGNTDAELAGATLVEVEERMGETCAFRLHYDVDIAEGDLPWLLDSRLEPGSKISVLAPKPDGSGDECLVKGPVQGHRIVLRHGGAGSTLEARGSDTTLAMDREAKSKLWDGTDSDAVTSILDDYGYIPDVETTSAGHPKEKHTLVQRATDLRFVRRLALRNGLLFWVSCDAQGTETAHFKRPDVGATAAAELVINLESPSIEQLDIEWDVERPTSVEAKQLDLKNKNDIDGGVPKTPLSPLGSEALDAIATGTRSLHLAAPSDDAGDLRSRGEAALIEAGWFLRATCRTSLAALGKVVRAHTVVEVKGAGSRYSGKYYVAAVRHEIDAVTHRMHIELIRNAWG